ncbi:hypothetical protein DXG03_008651 [Asterophora parasitica]|uniref:Nephrocystin 3-like N-terminal domain-containing protein n=1 Tax=Asterophora parasitica TaxID=117018 RepID=A0A9P7KCN6_9AGAR|nr:hypothetical protein DXG03_008651 [Asterophora parasitica]
MGASSGAQGAFERARKAYIELLTAKERARIETPTTLSDLQLQAQSISTAFEENRTRRTSRFFRGLGNVANMLKPFERLLEGMARNNVEVFDEILDFFLTMAQEMDYVKLLEDTFEEAPLVMSVIEELYIAIIDFWAKAVKYYRPKPSKRTRAHSMNIHRYRAHLSTGTRIFSGLSNLLSSNYMAQKFQGLKAAITAQKLRLHHVASAQHFANSVLHHQEIKQQHQTARQTHLIAWIDAPSYESDFNAADKHHYPGTCEWIRQKPEYIGWEERKTDPFLVIYGIPGAGKTVLSSWLINQARTHIRALQEHVVLYHYFKASDVTKDTPVAAMRSLLDQLYEHLRRRMHHLLQDLEANLATRSTKVHVSFADLWAIFSPLTLQYSEPQDTIPAVTIVLDAMDECKGSKPLVRELQKLVDIAAGAIKVIVTARRSGDHVDEFARFSIHRLLFLEISRDDVKHDIASFTQYKINKIERLRGPHLESLRSSIIAELGKAENHQGMFLWTYLMCKEVKRQLQVSAIWRLLQNLPRGLDAMYARICKGMAENDQHKDFGKSVLQWIVASSRPLRFGELEQALKTMQTQSSKADHFFDDDVYDDDYGLGLLWSRKDIVEACGDLVTYTGLDEGDMVGLIHLSARQFLRSNPTQLHLPPDLQPSLTSISSFLVDVSRAECVMGATCIDFLLSGSLHSDSYFARPLNLSGVLDDSTFLKRHPLFQYAVEYWPEYLLDVLEAISGEPETRRLLEKVVAFAAHTFSSTWLEEYMRQMGTEFTLYTAQRLSAAPSSIVPSDFLLWAQRVAQMVDDYAQTLSRKPQLVRICLQKSPTDFSSTSHSRSQAVLSFRPVNTSDANESVNGMAPMYPPLEKSSRTWLHYDSTSDSLFAVDGCADAIRLKRQVMKTGMRLRSQAASEAGDAMDTRDLTYALRSAAVSARAGFIAVTFLPVIAASGGAQRLYRTVCWSLITSATLSSASEWAEVAFVDRAETPRSDIFANRDYAVARANVVAFGKDNTLITPAGIWNLLTEELVDGPHSIYDPAPELRVTNTCFSGRGERVARVVRNSMQNAIEVEVLDISGVSLFRKGFLEDLESNELNLLNFSYSGEKIVVAKQFTQQSPPSDRDQLGPGRFSSRKLTFSFECFLVNDLKNIVLATPYPLSGLKYPQFSADETKLVAAIEGGLGRITDNTATSGYSIIVWSLAIDECGTPPPNHAPMVYLFKMWDPDFTFCIAPPPRGSAADEAIIVNKTGIISRRSIDTFWTSDDDRYLLELSRDILLAREGTTLSVLENGDVLGSMMCSDST